MRIAELSLERYGRFEGHQLVLPHRDQDFHLIYGPNEAGKTTTLCALADLLFGFEHRVSHDYRFSAPTLRVGAVLEAGGERLICRRRRGRTGTLVDAADAPIDEARLIAMLGGVSRDAFLQSSSLDHSRLRAGGRAMAESRDDLGQMLFAAGSGVTNLKQVLGTLDEELDALWGQRRSDKRAFTRAETRWKEAKGNLRDTTVKPAEWLRAKSDLDAATKTYLEADEKRQHATIELAAAERLRRVFPILVRRRAFAGSLKEHGGVSIPEAVEATARDALEAAAHHQQKQHAAEQLLETARQKLEAEPDQAAVVALSDLIDSLVQDLSGEQERRRLRPQLRSDLEGAQAEALILAGKLELDASAALTASIPAQEIIQKLRDLASRRVELATRVSAAEETATLAKEEVEAADKALAEAKPPATMSELQSAVSAAQRAGDLDEHIRKQTALVLRENETLQDSLRALAPWTGDTNALAALIPVADEDLDQAAANIDGLKRRAADAERVLDERSEALELTEARVEALRRAEGVVPLDTLRDARADRDQSVDRIAEHLDGKAALASPSEEVGRLRQLALKADDFADQRFAAADATAQLTVAEADVTQAQIRRRNAQDQLAKVTAEMEAAATAWLARLGAVSLPELQPDALRGWLRRRAQCLLTRSAHLEAEAELDRLRSRREHLLQELRAVLGSQAPQASDTLEPVLDAALEKLESLRLTAAAFDALKADSRSAHARREEALRGAKSALRQLQDWQVQWDAFNAEVGLNLQPVTAEVRLAAWEELARSRERLEQARRRLDRLEASSAAFTEVAREAATGLGVGAEGDPLEVTRQAKAALDGARAALARRQALQNEADSREQERTAAAAALAAAEAGLGEALTLTGTADRLSLAEALDQARDRRRLEAELRDVDLELAEQADGETFASLEAACAELTFDQASARAEDAKTQAEEAARVAIEARGVMSEAAVQFKRFEGQEDAANWALELELARAELDSLAETYILKKTQRLVLGHALKRQAERARHPLLTRASELFRSLTLERYADLLIDREADKPRLIGVCADGQTTVEVDVMSEGTQDQLFLALRLAAVEQSMANGARLPFLGDDLFVSFDDDRARSGLQVLGELSRTTQVLFFTHHAHLRDLAETLFPSLAVYDLQHAA